MVERLFRHFGPRYILVMMIATRLSGSIGGALVVYYVNLTLKMPPAIWHHWKVLAAIVVPIALVATTLLALWETRTLRGVLKRLREGQPIKLSQAVRAGREAVRFPSLHHCNEAWLVPVCTLLPVSAYLKLVDGVSWIVIQNITIAVFMGMAMALISTFFVIERWLQPVIRYLLEHNLPIEYEALPASRLRVRLGLCFSLIILTTALMIGTLAGQRASDIIRNPKNQEQAVASLRAHTTYISVAAVTMGLIFSVVLSQSVASRVGHIVQAMKRVEAGNFSERLRPTGNDEIDILTRQFNAMVQRLDENDQTIRDLHANLERKVRRRTRQLSKSKRQLQRSLRKLQEYDRLKTAFFSNVSHELRTPLTMILAPVERLLDKHRARLNPDVLSMLEVVQVNGQRLLDLINQLLDFSKLEAGQARLKITLVELSRFIDDLAAAARPLATQRGIRLDVEHDPAVPAFGGDVEKIETILSNLLSNAIKFTPAGGRVVVQTKRRGEKVRVSVIDSGIGIPKSDQRRIFERFVQLDSSASREFSGTGLGLALAKELVQLHGGQIDVRSEPRKGSTFWFDLPLAPSPGPSPSAKGSPDSRRTSRFAELAVSTLDSPSEAPRTDLPADAPTILVVDDTPEMRVLLGDVLSDQYRVLFARDGAEGINAALRELPDLIIADVMMPNVDGYQFCRRMKEDPATLQIPFVMLTARAERSMKIEGLDRGADDYLVKPFDAEELRARVRSLLKLRRLHQALDQRNSELEATLKELRETQAQLIQSEKLNSLGQLVAGIAHELNNAINAVYNGIQPLRSKTHQLESLVSDLLVVGNGQHDPEVHEKVQAAFAKIALLANVIENGASRTAQIVSDLKTFSHPGSEEPDRFDLHESLDMCLNLLSNQMRHRVEIRKNYGDVGVVYGPRGQLNQVFMNILNNAQQAIPEHGEVTITTRREGDQVLVNIRDTGEGIPEEVQNQIFDPFFTTKGPGIGTGLGLSLSYGLLKRIGGTIHFTSEVGRGTEFTVSFPSPTGGETKVHDPNDASHQAAGTVLLSGGRAS